MLYVIFCILIVNSSITKCAFMMECDSVMVKNDNSPLLVSIVNATTVL